jgi:adenylate cyclase
MPYEIERKFLVRDESWRASAGRAMSIRQGYLSRNGSTSLRIRLLDGVRAKLTIKSPVSEIRRLEFEYEIPMADGTVLLGLREGGVVEKLRYNLPCQDLVWEIDVFQGENRGLIIAEIELPHKDKIFEKPDWLGREVTSDRRYSSANLAKVPFQSWPDPLQDLHVLGEGSGYANNYPVLQAQCGGVQRHR